MKTDKLNNIRAELAEKHSYGFMDGPPRAFALFSFCVGWDAAMERVKILTDTLELIYESRDKTLFGRCCIDSECYVSDGTCSAQITAHNAFIQNAMEAKEALAKFRGEE